MNDTARKILADFQPHEVLESLAFDHQDSERAFLFHTYGFDVATTEREYIEFLYALLVLEKPRYVLESGSGSGIATLVMLAALKQVDEDFGRIAQDHPLPRPEGVIRRPEMWTVDTRYVRGVKLLAQKYEVDHYLTIPPPSTTLHYLGTLFKGNESKRTPKEWTRFDFAVFDSVQEQKALEAEYMLRKGLLQAGATLVFHDTAFFHPLNVPHPTEKRDYLSHLGKLEEEFGLERFTFPWSRGLTIMRFHGHRVDD